MGISLLLIMVFHHTIVWNPHFSLEHCIQKLNSPSSDNDADSFMIATSLESIMLMPENSTGLKSFPIFNRVT